MFELEYHVANVVVAGSSPVARSFYFLIISRVTSNPAYYPNILTQLFRPFMPFLYARHWLTFGSVVAIGIWELNGPYRDIWGQRKRVLQEEKDNSRAGDWIDKDSVRIYQISIKRAEWSKNIVEMGDDCS